MTDVHALSGAYAIDALDTAERRLFDEHLSGCAACREEVAGLQEAGSALSAASPLTPPAILRERVLADIAVVRPLPPVVSSLAQHRSRRRGPALLAAAAAVAVVAVGVSVVQPWNDDTVPSAAPTPSAPTTASVADRVLAAADAETHARALEVGGSMTVVRSRSLDEGVIIAQGLPSPTDDDVYEAWLRLGGRMVPAGLMSSGNATLVLQGNVSGATAVALTVEKAGGSRRPTSQPVGYFPFGQV